MARSRAGEIAGTARRRRRSPWRCGGRHELGHTHCRGNALRRMRVAGRAPAHGDPRGERRHRRLSAATRRKYDSMRRQSACTRCSRRSLPRDTAPLPYTPHAEEAAIESERRSRIRGLGISALFGMQVMLLSIALYASDGGAGMNPAFEQLFRWLAMTLTVPVLVWPGRAFFTGAAAAIRGRRLTMDVPVALGLSIAFAGSAFATITGSGEIWFDSVVMFVTLLSGATLPRAARPPAGERSSARPGPLRSTRRDEIAERRRWRHGRGRPRERIRGREQASRRARQCRFRRGTCPRRRASTGRSGADSLRRGGSRRRSDSLGACRARRGAAHRGVGSDCTFRRRPCTRGQREQVRSGRDRGDARRRHDRSRGCAPACGAGGPRAAGHRPSGGPCRGMVHRRRSRACSRRLRRVAAPRSVAGDTRARLGAGHHLSLRSLPRHPRPR